MNFENYTERAQAVLQAAQTAALAAGHQQFLPEHILKSMLEDRDQLAVNLIRASGGQPERVTQLTDEALRAVPKVSGGDSGLRMDQKT
ncbi:MAG: ATP-dependent chaperone ClpB, partial [Alphaproteobacteria bacterium]|nr:ATP-dependent chaperone ClpB [Alphaproteobacteria bacterium]